MMPEVLDDFDIEALLLASDQEQYQITGGECIFSPEPEAMGWTGNRIRDEFHRWNNDLEIAIARGGLATVQQAGNLILNIGYAPWQKANFFQLLCEQGHKIPKTLDANAKLVTKLLPRRILDVGNQNVS